LQGDTRTHGLWEKTAAAAPATTVLSGHATADVVVIGAGYTGLSTALHLGKTAAAVVVLEAVDIGFGGSGRNVGLVNAGMWAMPQDVVDTLGEPYGERLVQLFGNAPQLVYELIERHAIECELERAGTLHCAVGEKGLQDLKRRAVQWAARGASVRLLDAAETAAKTGSSMYGGALLDLRAGTIQPLAYARGLARAAIDSGARIFTGSRVLSAEHSNGRWIIHTAGGSVSADWVVVGTDAYATGPWREVRSEQIHLPYFNFATAPLGKALRASILPGKHGAWDTRWVLSSFRLDRSGRLIFGSVGALRGTGASVHRNWAERAVRKIFPQLGAVAFHDGWYGQIGMTDNNLPRFHQPAPKVIGFAGYNGRGIAPGTLLGRVLADYISGKIPDSALPLPVTAARAPRLRRLREAFYEVGSQVAHLMGARF
jgi:glycine/D-amino acid oxidase-like deaminating enzyme